jgi:3-oxoacyl-[acyl-carrier-protein] synthase III
MTHAFMRSVVRGVGKALPKNCVTNADLEKTLDTTDEWIVQRTGIHQRYIAGEGETTVSLGVEAAQDALKNAGLKPQDIDLIILGTATPNNTFPASAVEIQNLLGISHGFAFDVQAVCSGFLYGFTTADMYLRCGQAKRALVIGAETFSRILDWEDRTTCVLFGDGAGAIILEAVETTDDSAPGVLYSSLRADGAHKDKLYVDGGVSTTQTTGHLRMEGREVFKHAVAMITDVIYDVLEKAEMTVDDIDWFVPHQANVRIVEGAAKKLGIPLSKVVVTVGQHGNTSAASVPLALEHAVSNGSIKPGDMVLLEAMGGGFTWGASLVRW